MSSSPDPPASRSRRRRSAAQAPEVVDVDHSFDANGLYALRATLAAHASELGATDQQIEHLIIVGSELANNAVRHGGGSGRLRLWHHGSTLYCQVTDQGPGIADPTVGHSRPDPRSSDAGRGMWICRRLTTELIIENGPDGRGTVVTAAIPAPKIRQPGPDALR